MSENRKQRTRYTVRNGRLYLSKWETSTAFEAFWCSLFENNFSLAVLLVYTHDNERTIQETQLPIISISDQECLHLIAQLLADPASPYYICYTVLASVSALKEQSSAAISFG
jgi:hypothetical protein